MTLETPKDQLLNKDWKSTGSLETGMIKKAQNGFEIKLTEWKKTRVWRIYMEMMDFL